MRNSQIVNINQPPERDIAKNNEFKKDNLIYSLDFNNKTASLIANELIYGQVFIPRSIMYKNQEFIITSIGANSFKSSQIQSISFPSDSEIQIIGEYAFSQSSIEVFFLPANVMQIEKYAFFKCINLKNVVIPFISKLTSISQYLFSETSIESIFIPRHVKVIGAGAFFSCKHLTRIAIGANSELEAIENYAFYHTLIEEITIPWKVSKLDSFFYRADKLKSVKIVPNNKYFINVNDTMIIGKSDINSDKYDSLIFVTKRKYKTIVIPSFITIINQYAFEGVSIETLFIPSSVTEIRMGAFQNAKSLDHIDFAADSKLECFENNLFDESSIKSIFIPAHIKQIKDEAFTYCHKLKNVDFHPDSELQIIGDNAFFRTRIREIHIPPHVTEIKGYAFSECFSLFHIEIPFNSELQRIEREAFSGTIIEELFLPSSVSNLCDGWSAFTGKLTKVTIDPNNKYYKNYEENEKLIFGKSNIDNDEFDVLVFASRNIKSVTIPPNIQIIASNAFEDSQIEEIYLPSQITQICECAFAGCEKLRKIVISPISNLQTIEIEAFDESMITSIYIPPHVTKINEDAFKNCKNLHIIEFDENFCFGPNIESRFLHRIDSIDSIVMIPTNLINHLNLLLKSNK